MAPLKIILSVNGGEASGPFGQPVRSQFFRLNQCLFWQKYGFFR
jgi:hypothetical protein